MPYYTCWYKGLLPGEPDAPKEVYSNLLLAMAIFVCFLSTESNVLKHKGSYLRASKPKDQNRC